MITKLQSQHYDAIVIGARCAGASTALQLARRGARVLLIDRAARGSDTLSTHALMAGGVQQLSRWGLLDRIARSGAPPIRSTTFHYGQDSVKVDIKAKRDFDALYAPRRTVLDEMLVTAAEEAGVEVHHQVELVSLNEPQAQKVRGVVLRDTTRKLHTPSCDLVVGADGLRSRVAKLTGARTYRTGKNSAACIYGYYSGLGFEGYQWCYGEGCSAGVIPTNDGLSCVFVGMPHDDFHSSFRSDLKGAFRHLLLRAGPALVRHFKRNTGLHRQREAAWHDPVQRLCPLTTSQHQDTQGTARASRRCVCHPADSAGHRITGDFAGGR